MATNDVVLETLTEKVQRQDRFIAELQAELQRAREASVNEGRPRAQSFVEDLDQ